MSIYLRLSRKRRERLFRDGPALERRWRNAPFQVGYPGERHQMPRCCDAMYLKQQSDNKMVSAPPNGKPLPLPSAPGSLVSAVPCYFTFLSWEELFASRR